jgi:hypothetical protein
MTTKGSAGNDRAGASRRCGGFGVEANTHFFSSKDHGKLCAAAPKRHGLKRLRMKPLGAMPGVFAVVANPDQGFPAEKTWNVGQRVDRHDLAMDDTTRGKVRRVLALAKSCLINLTLIIV